MLAIEKIINGEELEIEIDYQSFNAKSESTGRTGTLYEFTLLAVEEKEECVIRVMHMDDNDEIIFSGVEAMIVSVNDPDALPSVASVIPLIEMEEEDFKKEICEYARSIINSL